MGSEVMQRIAVPVIGGMASSVVPTLVVIPALFAVAKAASTAASGRLRTNEIRQIEPLY